MSFKEMRRAEASDYDALYATGTYMSGDTNVFEYCRLKTIHENLAELARESFSGDNTGSGLRPGTLPRNS